MARKARFEVPGPRLGDARRTVVDLKRPDNPDPPVEASPAADCSPTGSYVIPKGNFGTEYCYSLQVQLDDAGSAGQARPGFDSSGDPATPVQVSIPSMTVIESPEDSVARTARLAQSPIRVFIADAKPLVLRGLRGLFESEPGFEVVGEETSDASLLDDVASSGADVLVVDLRLPESGALAVVEALHQASSRVRPVLLAESVGDREFLQARRLGVKGVVLKSMPLHLLMSCIRTVHSGGEFVEKATVLRALSALTRRELDPRPDVLTEREKAVMELVAAGLSNEQIAGRLGVGSGTVKSHLHSIYDKLGVHSRFALMRLVQKS